MATEEDLEKKHDEEEGADEASESSGLEESAAEKPAKKDDDKLDVRPKTQDELDAEAAGRADDEAREANASPMQLGYLRFVYAAYMAGAMLVAFLVAKSGHLAWYRLGQWKPELGEPRDEVVYVVAGLIGVGVALYYWRKPESRKYANEVAEELSKVTWPSRKEVTGSTTVVLFYTLFATVFFALMDQFWKYVTDKIYSF
jgi:preprotein translocase subunit SecE